MHQIHQRLWEKMPSLFYDLKEHHDKLDERS